VEDRVLPCIDPLQMAHKNVGATESTCPQAQSWWSGPKSVVCYSQNSRRTAQQTPNSWPMLWKHACSSICCILAAVAATQPTLPLCCLNSTKPGRRKLRTQLSQPGCTGGLIKQDAHKAVIATAAQDHETALSLTKATHTVCV
jgi:hypothetical protein